MKQVLICLDTSADNIIINYDDISFLSCIDLNSFINFPILQVHHAEIRKLKEELGRHVDELLSKREKSLDSRGVSMKYNGIEQKIDFRRGNGFHLGTLVALYNMIEQVILLKGCLYLFDRGTFKEYNSDRILYALKVRSPASENELKSRLSLNQRETQVVEDDTFEGLDIEPGISHLLLFGMIYSDMSDRVYGLTARGHMFIL